MSEKEIFIKLIDVLIEDADFDRYEDFSKEEIETALSFWEQYKAKKVSTAGKITENGKKILEWIKENTKNADDAFTSKEIAEALFTTGRAVAGSMRKLVTDGYIKKIGKDPIKYSLTENEENALV